MVRDHTSRAATGRGISRLALRARDPHRLRCAGHRRGRELLASLVKQRVRFSRWPARGTVRGPARARTLARGTPLPSAHRRGEASRDESTAESWLKGSSTRPKGQSAWREEPVERRPGPRSSVLLRWAEPRVGSCEPTRARPGTRSTSRGPGGGEARARFERTEFARAPRAAAGKSQAGRPRAAGGRGTHPEARLPPSCPRAPVPPCSGGLRLPSSCRCAAGAGARRRPRRGGAGCAGRGRSSQRGGRSRGGRGGSRGGRTSR